MTERPSTKLHPCAKPIKAMEWLVNKVTLEGETVFDPFMGSGTTGLAAVSLGCKFVGIEINPQYYQLAVDRITNLYRQPDYRVQRTEPKRKYRNKK